MTKKLGALLKGADSSTTPIKKLSNINATHKILKRICKGLELKSNKYSPSLTVKLINEYLESENNLGVMMYSDITAYVSGLDDDCSYTFTSNLTALMSFVDGNKEISPECMKFVVKLYDHTQLALFQAGNIKSILEDSISEANSNIKLLYDDVDRTEDKLLNIQKEYVAILGIFASIVVTLVAGISLSGNTLTVLKNAGPCEITFFVLLLVAFSYNTLRVLFRFILKIVGRNVVVGPKWDMDEFNIAIIILVILDFGFYMAMSNEHLIRWLGTFGFVFK